MQFFAIYIALIAAGLLLRKTSRVYIAVVIAFLTLITALNTTHADYAYYNGYMLTPERYDPKLFEQGWQLVCAVGRATHLSYSAFAAVLVCLMLCLTAWACSKLKANGSFFWALLLIFPALLNIVQIRQFVAMTFVFAAGVIFATRPKRFGIPVYILGVLLATMFHKTAFIMFILLGIPLLQRCSTPVKVAIVAGITVLIALSIAFAPIVLQPLLGDHLVDSYLYGREFFTTSSVVTHNRILMGAALIILGFALFFLCDRYTQHGALAAGTDDETRRIWLEYVRFAKYVALVALALIPFVFLDADILRVYRYFFIFGVGACGVVAFAPRKRLHRVGWEIATLAFVCLAAFAFVNYGNTFNTVTASLLTFTGVPALLS